MNKELINFAISNKIAQLKNRVSYYENGYYPELKECTGFSQYEHLEIAKSKLAEFIVDVSDYRKTLNVQYLGFSKTETANYLRLYAIEQREQANDFKDSNVYIKVRSLRNCINALNELKTLIPELNIYSNHWLSLRKPISLNF